MISRIHPVSLRSAQAETRFVGIGVSPGIVTGIVVLYRDDFVEPAPMPIGEDQIPAEIGRFQQALKLTKEQIEKLGDHTASGIIGGEIFESHLLMVDDPKLMAEVGRRLNAERVNVEFIYSQVMAAYAQVFGEMADPYLRARAQDVRDVASRVLRNLAGSEPGTSSGISYPHLIVGHDLTPSNAISINRNRVLGFATDAGSPTSHTAIISRALGIPAVVGCHDLTSRVKGGDRILIDGYAGVVILNPRKDTIDKYRKLESEHAEARLELEKLRDAASETRDGRHIVLSANVRLLSEIPSVSEHGAEGIGLYRTEFLYLNKPALPTEVEQHKAYSEAAAGVHPHKVIIRTVDIGGDKMMPALNRPQEANPFLGMRGIRFCLKERVMFRTQLRAILRASVSGNIRLMYPMVTTIEELREANAILQECRDELAGEGIPFDPRMEVGAMIETPAAALIADLIGREVDFLSIGTNDLIQYTTAVDRQNDELAHLYQPTHPAVIRLLRMVVAGARANNIWVGVCGEMAGDVLLTPLLLGLGIDELSTSPSLVPLVKHAIRSLEMQECRDLAGKIESGSSTEGILQACREVASSHYPEILS